MIVRLVGAIAGAAAIVLVVLLVTGGGGGYQVKVNLPDADGLLAGSRVEIGGVQVGSVNSLKVTPQDHAMATITIDKADEPIGTDASVVIRPADLLGEKYLDLSVGNRAHPARSGFTIPAAHTQDSADLDQVLDVLAPSTRDRLAILIHEAGVALFGRGRDLQAVLSALPPSVGDVQSLIDQVDASNAQLSGLLTHAGDVVGTLSAQRRQLGDFVGTAARAFTATAARQQQLQRSIAAAPGTLTALDATLGRLDTAGAQLRPAAAGLVRTAPGLTATLNALPGFTTAALPALAEVKSIAPDLVRLGRQASPVIARLRPTAQSLNTLAGDSNALTNSLDLSAADLLGTLQNWARAIQTHDNLGHIFRVSTEVSPNFITSVTPFILGTLGSLRRSTAHHAASVHPARPTSSGTATSTGSSTTPTTPTTPTKSSPLPAPPLTTAPVVKAVQGLLGYLLGK
ncbi:MAG TPA: MlaD family protein [Solirubrobacteraceae bacterium]|nr:MlaD family protein [Solirubrobacteraceae bacterium]